VRTPIERTERSVPRVIASPCCRAGTGRMQPEIGLPRLGENMGVAVARQWGGKKKKRRS
jgi:hypothetical protein